MTAQKLNSKEAKHIVKPLCLRAIQSSLPLFLLLPWISVLGQKTRLIGNVTADQGPVSFVTLELKNTNDPNKLQHGWTDSLGRYQFEVYQNQSYSIKASRIGYRPFTSDTIYIQNAHKEQVYDFSLQEDINQLREVTVVSRRNEFETDKGKMVFNIQQSSLTSGQTALDMLGKLPGISIGPNEEILFRGSSGINVMLNGRMTYLAGNQLAGFLKGMSAEDISKIELDTTPSAQFDAAGNSGIINIVSKKSIGRGYALDLRSSVSKGKYWMTNQNITASLRTKSFNIYASLDYNTPHTFLKSKSGNSVNDGAGTLQLVRRNENSFKTNYHTRHIELTWLLSPRHSLALDYHGYFDDWKGLKYSTVEKLNHKEEILSSVKTENVMVEPYHYDALHMHYGYTIDSLGKNITADANYTSYRNFSDGLMTSRNYTAEGQYLNSNTLKISQPGFVKIGSVKIDANLPFPKFVLKTGLKYAEVQNDNRFRYDSLQNATYVEIQSLSNHFMYSERIAAAYLSISLNVKNTSLDAGLRTEYTHANGYTVKQDISNRWSYTKLFPSLSLERTLNEGHKLSFSLSRRINRPSYTQLNPVRWYNDQYFYYSGNPRLIPELAWVHSLSYTLKGQYIFSAAYNRSLNYIDRRLSLDPNGVSIQSLSDNFGKRHRFDFTASIPFELSRSWNLRLYTDLSHTSYPISMLDGEKRLSLMALSAALSQDISLPAGIGLSLTANWFSSELRGIYVTRPSGFVNLGLKKALFEKKMIAQLTVTDLFNTNRFRASSRSDIADYYYNDKPYSRVFALSLKYHIGGELVKSGSRRTEEQERL
ncbi:TonB-dependent receptor [Marinilongibacter aquaticus]|uniref:outer membrane beta-barrel family protein n=1 Tax=Marinilongibacter aquaticus TaxID=2975157 RepID=UPI0021BD8A9E|nr:outer membrane beta-barrel family protein [Marinilongibacter aquaticus]UBM58608.1 TonB-dependent receptor [Marinilongibacter aquaticus]